MSNFLIANLLELDSDESRLSDVEHCDSGAMQQLSPIGIKSQARIYSVHRCRIICSTGILRNVSTKFRNEHERQEKLMVYY